MNGGLKNAGKIRDSWQRSWDFFDSGAKRREKHLEKKIHFFMLTPKTHQSHTTQSQSNLKNQNEYNN